ncbi:hypothetical protein BCR42DRAFT_442935 [Absidia repens]|uniref:Uncharacterized protein n=1 Tax=Absidia repens TaxID=90262 RepID=A0A1X2I0P3_9FUNG|nr:hypothetical protein BCR42DRAFT_442935 [Absidia repens]
MATWVSTQNFPATAYIATGASVPGVHDNEVVIVKLSNFQKTQHGDEGDEDGDVQALHKTLYWNIDQSLTMTALIEFGLDIPGSQLPKRYKPLAIYSQGREEGSSLDVWKLFRGDNADLLLKICNGHPLNVPSLFLVSPFKLSRFGTLEQLNDLLSIHTSNSDINIITWNTKASYLLVNGHEGGTSYGGQVSPVASFKRHNTSVTSIEGHPTEEKEERLKSNFVELCSWYLELWI